MVHEFTVPLLSKENHCRVCPSSQAHVIQIVGQPSDRSHTTAERHPGYMGLLHIWSHRCFPKAGWHFGHSHPRQFLTLWYSNIAKGLTTCSCFCSPGAHGLGDEPKLVTQSGSSLVLIHNSSIRALALACGKGGIPVDTEEFSDGRRQNILMVCTRLYRTRK